MMLWAGHCRRHGKINGMKTTIDRAGRLIVPKPIRERLRLIDGGPVDVEEHDGTIEVRPVPAEVAIIQTPQGPVASPISPLPPLTPPTPSARHPPDPTRR